MGWEIVVTYREILIAKENNSNSKQSPQMSIISSGSAAVAIQYQLNKYHLPPLNVLVDVGLRAEIIDVMESIGCELYRVNLSYKSYTWRDILKLTNNLDRFDITSNQAIDADTRFYDWLSYEIINNSPDYCFVPFGTGTLYVNIMNVNKREISSKISDQRFSGNKSILRRCNFIGATTSDPMSRAEKLYSPHLPFASFDEPRLRLYKTAGFCGEESGIYIFREKYLAAAMEALHQQGVECEPSGAAGLALLLDMYDMLPDQQKMILEQKKILVVNTG